MVSGLVVNGAGIAVGEVNKHAFKCEWNTHASFLFSLEVLRDSAQESVGLSRFAIGENSCAAVVLEVAILLPKLFDKPMLRRDSGY